MPRRGVRLSRARARSEESPLRHGGTMRIAICVFAVCVFVIAISAIAAPAESPIRNATFERGSADWELHVYGAKPIVAGDEEMKNAGHGSLRVSADEPSDTALGQEIELSPSQWY